MELNNAFVRVLKGATKGGTAIENRIFKLIGHANREPNLGLYITVDGEGHADLRQGKNRIYIKHATDYELVDAKSGQAAVTAEAEVEAERTDDEISADLKETFDILGEMTGAVVNGVIKGLVISGPAGIGKSHTTETVLEEELGVPARLAGMEPKFDIFKGNLSAITLYCQLYKYADENSVLVLDDCDGLLYDEDALNVLKAVLDTKKVRRVHWGTNSTILEKEGVPSSFEFKGGIIFLTNMKWDNCKSPRIANHLNALMSRVHYMDVKIDTLRERLVHMKNVALNTDMLDDYGFSRREKTALMDWLLENVNKLQFVDLRTVIKAADLMKAMPTNWQSRASKTLFKNGGR